MKNLLNDPRVSWHAIGMHKERRSLPGLLAPLRRLTESSRRLFEAPTQRFELNNEFYSIPRFLFVGPGQGSTFIRIGIFAGIHGDEIAGSLAAVELVRQLEEKPELGRGYELYVYPVTNPTGFEDNTRFSRRGKDLNREFWKDSREAEIRILEEQLKEQHFQGLISLHADDTSDGLYGFVRGATLTRDVLAPALEKASTHLPRNFNKIIDGFAAHNGIITKGYEGILSAPPSARQKPFEVVLETPQLAPLDKQVEAHVSAVLTMLETYRSFISYSADL
jgi:murein peptide amidase A